MSFRFVQKSTNGYNVYAVTDGNHKIINLECNNRLMSVLLTYLLLYYNLMQNNFMEQSAC